MRPMRMLNMVLNRKKILHYIQRISRMQSVISPLSAGSLISRGRDKHQTQPPNETGGPAQGEVYLLFHTTLFTLISTTKEETQKFVTNI